MTKKRSQTLMLDHSKAKVLLLKKYIEKYLSIIANDGFTRKIEVFDLFCGEGFYDNGGIGSPIVLLNVLNDLHKRNEGKNLPKINLVFNDKDRAKIHKLKNGIKRENLHVSDYGELHFREKDYKSIIHPLAEHICKYKNEKAFIFIDPYGYKEIKASEIKSLLKAKKSEVLLFLPTQFMYRFDEKGTPQALIDIIQEMVSLSEWKQNESVYHFIEQFKEGLKKYLGSDFFVDTFTIEKDPATVFCLFFFSSHILGFEKMLETKWQIDAEEGKGWSYQRASSLFGSLITNVLEEKLIALLESETRVFNGDVYEFTLRNGFLPRHTVEIFSSLAATDNLHVFLKNGEKARKGAFYIGYGNYKSSYDKVYYKLN